MTVIRKTSTPKGLGAVARSIKAICHRWRWDAAPVIGGMAAQ